MPERAKARAAAGGAFLLSAAARGFQGCRSYAGQVGFEDYYAEETRNAAPEDAEEGNSGAAE